jgi:signal recognition particle GTPase
MWYTLSTKEVERQMQTNIEFGLNEKQVEDKQNKFGLNKLEEKKKESIIIKFVKQFNDFMIIILIIASIISAVVAKLEGSNDYFDSIIIIAIVVFNAIMGLAGAGKTIVLTNIAAQYYLQGYNVLYISLEMSKEQISQRIDAHAHASETWVPVLTDAEEQARAVRALELERLQDRASFMPRLLHGDVFEQLRGLPDASFDLVCIDPPYNMDKAA